MLDKMRLPRRSSVDEMQLAFCWAPTHLTKPLRIMERKADLQIVSNAQRILLFPVKSSLRNDCVSHRIYFYWEGWNIKEGNWFLTRAQSGRLVSLNPTFVKCYDHCRKEVIITWIREKVSIHLSQNWKPQTHNPNLDTYLNKCNGSCKTELTCVAVVRLTTRFLKAAVAFRMSE